MSMFSRRGALCAGISASFLLLLAPASAFAGTGAGLFIDAFTSFGRVDDYSLHVASLATEPDPLKERGLSVFGGGNFHGGGVHLAIYGSEVRGGVAMGAFTAQGLDIHHDALPTGISASLGSAWGANWELFIGHEFLKGPVYPYLDLRAVFNVIQANIELRHPDYGVLGATPYNAFSFGVGPRIGIAIPLSDPWVIDVSGSYGLFGAEQTTLVVSLGFWDH